jgi:hypothetical protein
MNRDKAIWGEDAKEFMCVESSRHSQLDIKIRLKSRALGIRDTDIQLPPWSMGPHAHFHRRPTGLHREFQKNSSCCSTTHLKIGIPLFARRVSPTYRHRRYVLLTRLIPG